MEINIALVIALVFIFGGLIFCVIGLYSENKTLEADINSLIHDMQTTENINTRADYQDRTFVTKLKLHTVYVDMDDASFYEIEKNT